LKCLKIKKIVSKIKEAEEGGEETIEIGIGQISLLVNFLNK